MNTEMELTRLRKENETFRKIIETQEKTIKRLIYYFILEKRESNTKQITRHL